MWRGEQVPTCSATTSDKTGRRDPLWRSAGGSGGGGRGEISRGQIEEADSLDTDASGRQYLRNVNTSCGGRVTGEECRAAEFRNGSRERIIYRRLGARGAG